MMLNVVIYAIIIGLLCFAIFEGMYKKSYCGIFHYGRDVNECVKNCKEAHCHTERGWCIEECGKYF